MSALALDLGRVHEVGNFHRRPVLVLGRYQLASVSHDTILSTFQVSVKSGAVQFRCIASRWVRQKMCELGCGERKTNVVIHQGEICKTEYEVVNSTQSGRVMSVRPQAQAPMWKHFHVGRSPDCGKHFNWRQYRRQRARPR